MKRLLLIFVLTGFALIQTACLAAGDKAERLEVLYFHATTRCEGCLAIESNITNSLNLLYSKELKDSSITFKSIDFQEEENERFMDKYKFDTQTLILSKKVNGKEVKWKNLDKIWDYSSDFEKFQSYIHKEADKLLKKDKKEAKK